MVKISIDTLVYSTPYKIENEDGNINNLLEFIISSMVTTLVFITK